MNIANVSENFNDFQGLQCPKLSKVSVESEICWNILKTSILIRFSIINHPFWGTPIFGNPHILEKFFFAIRPSEGWKSVNFYSLRTQAVPAQGRAALHVLQIDGPSYERLSFAPAMRRCGTHHD